MRKKLLFCSALLLSASLAGCGYNDDNVRETVPALPETCSSTNECFVGSTGGVCVEGHCLRSCEERTDCEDGTICESGLCRHIVDCPTMDYENDFTEYRGKKCLKVFSHTPTTNWVNLLKEDVRITSVTGRNASSNFTSKNFTFQVPNRALMGGLNYSLVIASSLIFITIENMASTAFMQCVMPKTATDSSQYQITIDKSDKLKLTDNTLFTVCDDKVNKEFWDNDFTNICTNDSNYMKRFDMNYRNIVQETNTSLTQALAGMNELLNNANTTKTILESEKKTNNIDCSSDTTGENDEKDELCTQITQQEELINDLREHIEELKQTQTANEAEYAITSRCDRAMLALQTLQKVYGVITQATLNQEQASRTSTYKVGTWLLDLLQNGTTSTEHSDTINDQQKKLPKITSCDVLATKMREIQTNICYYLMDGIQENPLSNVLDRANLDLTTCLTNEATAPALLQNGFKLVKEVGELTGKKIPETLVGIAQALMAVMASGNAELASNFSDMSKMVTAIGDPTFIWLTENNIQELNILSDQTEKNVFKENDLMLGIKYKTLSAAIANNPLDLNVYDGASVEYVKINDENANLVPKMKSDSPEKIGRNLFTVESDNLITLGMLSRFKFADNGRYGFYFNPKITAGTTLMCGGVTLDISAIEGYVVLTDDQINSMNGTALIVETQN